MFPYPHSLELALIFLITRNICTPVLEKVSKCQSPILKFHIKLCFPVISASISFSSISTKLTFSKNPVKSISYAEFNGCWFLEPWLEEWSKWAVT